LLTKTSPSKKNTKYTISKKFKIKGLIRKKYMIAANKLPKVPGAIGDKPAPKPIEIQVMGLYKSTDLFFIKNDYSL
jgi:hypothetical protein